MKASRPTQVQLKQYLTNRRAEGGPPPTPERIREMLGWNLIPANKK